MPIGNQNWSLKNCPLTHSNFRDDVPMWPPHHSGGETCRDRISPRAIKLKPRTKEGWRIFSTCWQRRKDDHSKCRALNLSHLSSPLCSCCQSWPLSPSAGTWPWSSLGKWVGVGGMVAKFIACVLKLHRKIIFKNVLW